MTAREAHAEKAAGRRPSRVRNGVASVLLILALAALCVELKARRDLAAAGDALERLLVTQHHHRPLPRSEVEALVGRAPSGPIVSTGVEREATYVWRGLRPHCLKVIYIEFDGKPATLVRFEVP